MIRDARPCDTQADHWYQVVKTSFETAPVGDSEGEKEARRRVFSVMYGEMTKDAVQAPKKPFTGNDTWVFADGSSLNFNTSSGKLIATVKEKQGWSEYRIVAGGVGRS